MRPRLEQCATLTRSGECCGGSALPRDQCASWCRAWEPLILGGADVDQRDRVQSKVNSWRDGEVVGAVWDVSEQQDDDERPEHGAEGGPAPAGGIEESKKDAARRGAQRRDRRSADWRWQVAHHFTVSAPTMFGCTVQMKT